MDVDRMSKLPAAQIPEEEMWLWKNNDALDSVKRGLEDAEHSRLHHIGSFAQYDDREIKDPGDSQ